jgi:hypothetical protein
MKLKKKSNKKDKKLELILQICNSSHETGINKSNIK